MPKYILSLILLIAFTNNLNSQLSDSAVIQSISNYAFNSSTAFDNLRYLCKQIGNRISGSPQLYQAEKWSYITLLQAGTDTVYTQTCQVPHWVRGSTETGTYKWLSSKNGALTVTENKVNISSLGNSQGTSGKALTAPLIAVQNFAELEKLGEAVKGKIVLFNYAFNQNYLRTFMGYANAVPYRVQSASKAAKLGAVAVVVRSVSSSTDNNPHTGVQRYTDSVTKIPAVAIGVQDAITLNNLLQNGKVLFTLTNTATMLTDTLGSNVIGEIRGNLYPNQIITVGGHLDSWDIGEGAHDDGAGIVQSIAVLEYLKKIGYKPQHTIRAVLFTNEENGGSGGEKYAAQAILNKEEHIAAIESDAGGFTPIGFGGTMTDAQFTKFASWLPLLKVVNINEITKGGGGSDIAPLAKKLGTPTIGLQPDSQRYFDLHHSRNDTFEQVSRRELQLGAAAIASLVYLIDKYGL